MGQARVVRRVVAVVVVPRTSPHGDSMDELVALDNDGCLWLGALTAGNPGWTRLKDIPTYGEVPPVSDGPAPLPSEGQ